jgi:small subunit ribosomal protein S6
MANSYDLFVLLDPEVPEDRRTAIVEQVKSQLGSGGASLKGDADWGMRRLSYEIDHRREARYHLFQFEGTPNVLTQLDRALSIEDAVLRHRIIRLPGEAPETTPGPSEEPARRSADDRPPRDGGRERREDEDTSAHDAPEAEAPPPAGETEQAPAEPEPAAELEPAAEPEQAAETVPAETESAPDESA